MLDLAKLGIFVALIIVAISANLWVVDRLWSLFQKPGSQVVLAPVDFGSAETEKARGVRTARHALAKLDSIQAQLERTFDYLRNVQSGAAGGAVPQDATRARPIISSSTGGKLYEPVDVKLKIGDIEFGGLLSWVSGWFASEQLDRFSVVTSGPANATKLTLAGSGPSLSAPVLAENLESDDKAVGDAIAYGIAQQRFIKMFGAEYTPSRAIKDHTQFKVFIDALTEAVRLDENERSGALPSESEYKAALASLKSFADSMAWPEVIEIAGRLAQRAKDKQTAIAYYERAAKLVGEGSAGRKRLGSDIETLKRETTAIASASASAASQMSASAGRPRTFESALKEINKAAFPLALLKLPEPVANPADVGVLGAKPTPWAGDAGSGESDTLPAYTSAMGQIAAAFAGSDKVITFGEMDASASLLQQGPMMVDLQTLILKGCKIILVPYQTGPMLSHLFESASDRIFVLTAGSDTQPNKVAIAVAQRPNVFVVGAVTADGAKASFSSDHPEAFWAPGDGLTVLEPGLTLDAISGTGPAAAAFAGALARILPKDTLLSPEKIKTALKKAETPQGATVQRLVDFGAAAKSLAAGG